jgi:hypothetical protein
MFPSWDLKVKELYQTKTDKDVSLYLDNRLLFGYINYLVIYTLSNLYHQLDLYRFDYTRNTTSDW